MPSSSHPTFVNLSLCSRLSSTVRCCSIAGPVIAHEGVTSRGNRPRAVEPGLVWAGGLLPVPPGQSPEASPAHPSATCPKPAFLRPHCAVSRHHHTSADTGDSSLKATFQPFSAGRMFSQTAAPVACPCPPQQRPRRVLRYVGPAVAAFFQPGVLVPKESVQVQ